jgi:hypothetical protein
MRTVSSDKDCSPAATRQMGEWVEWRDREATCSRDGREHALRIFVAHNCPWVSWWWGGVGAARWAGRTLNVAWKHFGYTNVIVPFQRSQLIEIEVAAKCSGSGSTQATSLALKSVCIISVVSRTIFLRIAEDTSLIALYEIRYNL